MTDTNATTKYVIQGRRDGTWYDMAEFTNEQIAFESLAGCLRVHQGFRMQVWEMSRTYQSGDLLPRFGKLPAQ